MKVFYRSYGPLPNDIHFHIVPGIARAAMFFPSYKLVVDGTTLRYAVGGVSASEAPSLNAITSRCWNGRLAGELYDEVIRPVLRGQEQ